MARKPRIEYEGAFYHVITRGNQRQAIFEDKTDHDKYLEVLAGYKERYHYHLYAYVLMKNHVHLLIETTDTPLSKILQGINQTYTLYFNKKNKTVGHLFQGRYKAILCDKDEYLLTLVKYIHNNPVRAKVVKNLSEYLWSSHQIYVEKAGLSKLVDTDQVLRMFSENKAKARQLYKAYMNDSVPVTKKTIYSTVDQRVLGDEHFVDYIMEKNVGELKKEAKKREHSLQAITKAIESILGVTRKEIQGRSKDKGLVEAKRKFCLMALKYGYSGREIGRYMGKDPAIVTRYGKDKMLYEQEIEKITAHLSKVNSQV